MIERVQSQVSCFIHSLAVSQRPLELLYSVVAKLRFPTTWSTALTAAIVCALMLLTPCYATAKDESTNDLEKVIKQGRAKAQGCTRCHGRNGMQKAAKQSDWDYSVSTFVIKQLLLFRGNRRSHEIMNAVAKPLTNLDIYEIALWYESVSKSE